MVDTFSSINTHNTIYINDLAECVSISNQLLLFVDNTKYFKTITIVSNHLQLQEDLQFLILGV